MRVLPRICLALLCLGGTSAAYAAAGGGRTVSVVALDNSFDPTSTPVQVGDTVTWANHGTSPHNVTAVDGSFTSGNMDAGKTYSHTFAAAGTVSYYCTYHGTKAGTGMYATLVVQAAGSTTSTTSHPRTGGGHEVRTGALLLAVAGLGSLGLLATRRRQSKGASA